MNPPIPMPNNKTLSLFFSFLFYMIHNPWPMTHDPWPIFNTWQLFSRKLIWDLPFFLLCSRARAYDAADLLRTLSRPRPSNEKYNLPHSLVSASVLLSNLCLETFFCSLPFPDRLHSPPAFSGKTALCPIWIPRAILSTNSASQGPPFFIVLHANYQARAKGTALLGPRGTHLIY